MIVQDGGLISFAEYLGRARESQARPAVWRGTEIWQAAREHAGQARGAVALTPGSADAAPAAAPGISLTAQIVEPGAHAPAHSHSFWHLYFVLRGEGHIAIDGGTQSQQLLQVRAGDWLFVPAWCVHAVDNRAGTVPFELFVLQNLPQNAALGNLARADQGQPIEVTYAGA